MSMITVDTLRSIRVLFRAPDTLALYGVPYDMRPGQQPSDLWRSRRIPDPCAPPYHYGATVVSAGAREDWIWLGQPGWWSIITKEEQVLISDWLEKLGDAVPVNTYEWCAIPDLASA